MTGSAEGSTGSLVLEALRLPTSGRVLPLAMVLSNDRPIWPVHGPFLHFNLHSYLQGGRLVSNGTGPSAMGMLVDRVELPLHAGTRVDALNHIAVDNRLVDGSRADEVETSAGASVLGVETIAPFVGRGVLLDIAGLHGVEILPPDHEVTPQEVEAALVRRGLERLEEGDVVLIATGWMTQFATDRRRYFEREPGLGLDAARMLAAAGVRAVGADNSALERVPAPDPARPYPVHEALLAMAGIHIFENMVLDGLAAAEAGAFLFIAAPLLIRGATGSPITPLAVI